MGVSYATPLTTSRGTQRTRSRPWSSIHFSVWPPNRTSQETSGRGISQGFPLRSHLSVISACQPSLIVWSKMPNSYRMP